MQMDVTAVPKKVEALDDDFIALEILSRLPVESLMRFKCVSKRWQSIIQNDKFFKDLHFSRRKKITRRTSFLLIAEPLSKKNRSKHIPKERRENMYLLSVELLLPSEEEDGCVEVTSVCRWEPPIPKDRPISACKSLDGLICFMNTESLCARVYNCSTRESTPWIKSMIKQQSSQMFFLGHELGYDPATMEYKVIALWKKCNGYKSAPWSAVCQVMTVGQNSWRRIDYGMGVGFSPEQILSSVHVNGSIYLLCYHQYDLSFIVEFCVGSEEFRLVKTIAGPAGIHYPYWKKKKLMEVNGRLCMLNYNDPSRKSITMQILYNNDENVPDKKSNLMTTTSSISNSAADSSNYHWVEAKISLPHEADLNSIRCIPGTNLLIISSLDDGFSFFHNNQKKNCYSISNINNEISATLADEDGHELYRLELDAYTPNLLPVN